MENQTDARFMGLPPIPNLQAATLAEHVLLPSLERSATCDLDGVTANPIPWYSVTSNYGQPKNAARAAAIYGRDAVGRHPSGFDCVLMRTRGGFTTRAPRPTAWSC